MAEPKTNRQVAMKALRKIARDEGVDVASRLKAAELILKATEPRPRYPFHTQLGQSQRGAIQ